jgi:CubicO group peptidase (beta-lactamase class C family)
MKRAFRATVTAVALIVLWAAMVYAWFAEGWGRQPLSPRGDTTQFLRAAIRYIDANNRGNVAFALLEDGTVRGVHGASVGDPVNADTLFQAASLSKWVTAWGVMALADQGKIDLDAPVGRYLKRWSLPPSEFDNNQVTARRLLSHTSGLTDGLGYAGFAPGKPVQSLVESLNATADVSPGVSGAVKVGREPGSGWQYSGGGYAILQLLIEDVSGESFDAYMKRAIFQPLGMTRSTFDWSPSKDSRLAAFYDTESRPATHYRFAAVAATSLYTSASDLARFLQAQVPGPEGEPAGRAVLRPETIDQMWRPHASQYGKDIWGLGTILYAPDGSGGFVIGHDGSGAAHNTTARLNPANGDGIVVLETGSDLLATELGGEWVFWETGKVDILTLNRVLPSMLRAIGTGSFVIVATVLAVTWIRRPSSSARPPEPR